MRLKFEGTSTRRQLDGGAEAEVAGYGPVAALTSKVVELKQSISKLIDERDEALEWARLNGIELQRVTKELVEAKRARTAQNIALSSALPGAGY